MHLYIEPFSGISGDMFLGALCALSGAYRRIEELPAALGLDDARIDFEDVTKNGIHCRQVRITDLAAGETKQGKRRAALRHGPNRNLDGLLRIVEGSALGEGAKRISREILTSLARAEAEVHGVPVQEVHFHEVGAVDSLLDIVGCAVLLDLLDIEQVYSDPVCTGFGRVHTRHGLLPVPAPATAALLRGVPTFKGEEPGERATPTGAAILRYLDPSFRAPVLTAHAVAYGAGEADFTAPNVLRLSLVEPAVAPCPSPTLLVLECNIDDTPAELLGGDLQDDLRECGAAEVYLTAVQMKKGRPGVLLTALVPEERLDRVANWLLENTSTIGLRWHEAMRRELPRRGFEVATRHGPIQVKEAITPSGSRRIKIEYESIRRVSRQRGISLAQARDELLAVLTETIEG
jgi:uncharacterized protein (TIGR00299 family) protein